VGIAHFTGTGPNQFLLRKVGGSSGALTHHEFSSNIGGSALHLTHPTHESATETNYYASTFIIGKTAKIASAKYQSLPDYLEYHSLEGSQVTERI
jgi:hypothetical protein